MATTTLTEDKLENGLENLTSIDTSTQNVDTPSTAPKDKKPMSSYGLSSESLGSIMQEYSKGLDAGDDVSLDKMLRERAGNKYFVLADRAMDGQSTKSSYLNGTSAQKDQALLETMISEFGSDNTALANIMLTVRSNLSSKAKTDSPAADASASISDTPIPTITAEDKKITAPFSGKKSMSDFGLNSESIVLAMNDYARDFNNGKEPNLADIIINRGGKVTDLVEIAVNNSKTSTAIMSGSQAEKDQALLSTIMEQLEDDVTVGVQANKLMTIVSKGIQKKLSLAAEPEAKTTSPTPPTLPEVESAQAVDEKAANEAFLKQQFPKSLGKYVAGERGAPFGNPQSQMGQMVNKEGYGWHKPLEQRVAGFQAQKGKAEESYAKLAKELLEKQEAVEAKITAAKDRLAASQEASFFGFGDRHSRKAVKLAEKEREIVAKQQEVEAKAYDKQISMLERKEKIYGTASKAVETAGDAALVVKGMGIKGMAALSGVVNSFREAGLADLNKDKHDAGHLLLGVDTPENVNAFKEANAKKTPENKPEVKPEVKAEAKPEAKADAPNTPKQPAQTQKPEPIIRTAGHSFLGVDDGKNIIVAKEEQKPTFWDNAKKLFNNPEEKYSPEINEKRSAGHSLLGTFTFAEAQAGITPTPTTPPKPGGKPQQGIA